jgi:branched-chain amino acid transport system permease protein
MSPSREALTNLAIAAIFLAVPIWAWASGETFYITLATRIAILALAATGLNIALGLGGLVSFGHAAFFGLGGYVAGILATHAMNYEPLLLGLPGTNQMPIIWVAAIAVCGVVGLLIGAISIRTSGVYFIMITLAFAQMIFGLWRRGRAVDPHPQRLSGPQHAGADPVLRHLRHASGRRHRLLRHAEGLALRRGA